MGECSCDEAAGWASLGDVMTAWLWIFLGSGLGGVLRFGAATAVAARWGDSFPWGTLVVNVAGSFLIGFVAALMTADGRPLLGTEPRHFVMTGVLGGFTTYSSFSLQTLALARAGEWVKAAGNAGAMFVLCFVAVALGYLCAWWINGLRRAGV
jgi:CrcB protein